MPGNRGSDYESPEYSRRTLTLQDHGDLVSFRNIWMRKL